MVSPAAVGQIGQLAHNFNWHSPSWDLFILVAWPIGSVLYAFTAGRGRIINILLSIYIAKLLVVEAPFLGQTISGHLPSSLLSLQQLATFTIVFLILFLFLGRYAFRTSADGRQLGSLAFGLVFSVLQIGLLINTVLTYLPQNTQQNFSPLIQTLFIQGMAGFIWLVAPLVFLILLGRFVADPSEF
jgi:hypothetical protein